MIALQRTFNKVKDKKVGRTNLDEAHDVQWRLKLKRHKDHDLEQNYTIV